MPQPTQSDIEAAKAYLRQRLDAELSMSRNLEYAMREAAERIVEICYAAKITPTVGSYENLPMRVRLEIDEVIEWLKETIQDYFETLAIADHEENRNTILPIILGENHGANFNERLTDYCDKYRNELMLLVGAGLFLGVTKSALAKSIGENLKHPYANQLLTEGIDTPLTYGRGRSNSMFNAINTLTRYGIGKGWMLDRHIKAELESAQFFMTFRNSSFPCDICNDYASTMHPIDDEIPPLHAGCVCGTIYFNAFGEPIKL